MADVPYTLEDAQRLRERGFLDDETYSRIESKLGPQGPSAEEQKLRQQLSNPLFAPTTPSADFTDEQIQAEAAKRSQGSAMGLIGQAASTEKNKAEAEALRQAEIERLGGPKAAPQTQQPQMSLANFNMPMGPQAPAAPAEAAPVLASEVQNDQPRSLNVNPMAAYAQTINKPFEMMQSGVAQMLKTAELRGAEESAMRDRIFKEDQERIAKVEGERIKQQEFMTGKLDELNRKADEIGKQEIDPNRYWANKSTGEKVLAGIGLFLGAFGSNGNQAAKIIQNAINTDIESQKANLDQKSRGLQQQKGILGEMYSLTRDATAAKEAARVAYLNNAQMQLQTIAAKYQAPEAKAKAMQLMGELEGQKQQAQMNFAAIMQKSYQAQQIQDPTLQRIQGLPDDMKKRALDELTKVQEYGNFSGEVSKTYKTIMGTGAGGLLPSIMGGDEEAYKSAKAFLSGAIVGKVPGIKSDSDFENIVVPMLPKPRETMETAQRKAVLFDKFLKANSPAAPVLSGYGLMPQSAEEKLGVKTGFAGK